MLDIHTHLYFEAFDADREAVILRAREAGIKQMIVVGCDVVECRQAIDLARQYEDLYASVGIHPNEFRAGGSAAGAAIAPLMQELETFAQDAKIVAIGECGLDYSASHGGIDPETKARQHTGFIAQLELAEKLQLPVIVHCRPARNASDAVSRIDAGGDAYADVLEILKSKIVNLQSVVLHCYMGDTAVTEEFLALPNVSFSFTGNITYPVKKHLVGTKDDLTETVKLIPLARLFVETDCPFLAPQAKRGERNEPAYVLHTAQKVGELLGVTQPILEEALQKNFRKAFPRALSASL